MSDPKKADSLKDLQVPLAVVLAERNFSLAELVELRPGKVLEFHGRHDKPLDFCVGSSVLGSGRAVDLGEHLGFVVERVEPPRAQAGPDLS